MIDPRVQITSRRKLLSLGCTGGMMNLLGMSGSAQTSESKPCLDSRGEECRKLRCSR
jgi:hypothetical protein